MNCTLRMELSVCENYLYTDSDESDGEEPKLIFNAYITNNRSRTYQMEISSRSIFSLPLPDSYPPELEETSSQRSTAFHWY